MEGETFSVLDGFFDTDAAWKSGLSYAGRMMVCVDSEGWDSQQPVTHVSGSSNNDFDLDAVDWDAIYGGPDLHTLPPSSPVSKSVHLTSLVPRPFLCAETSIPHDADSQPAAAVMGVVTQPGNMWQLEQTPFPTTAATGAREFGQAAVVESGGTIAAHPAYTLPAAATAATAGLGPAPLHSTASPQMPTANPTLLSAVPTPGVCSSATASIAMAATPPCTEDGYGGTCYSSCADTGATAVVLAQPPANGSAPRAAFATHHDTEASAAGASPVAPYNTLRQYESNSVPSQASACGGGGSGVGIGNSAEFSDGGSRAAAALASVAERCSLQCPRWAPPPQPPPLPLYPTLPQYEMSGLYHNAAALAPSPLPPPMPPMLQRCPPLPSPPSSPPASAHDRQIARAAAAVAAAAMLGQPPPDLQMMGLLPPGYLQSRLPPLQLQLPPASPIPYSSRHNQPLSAHHHPYPAVARSATTGTSDSNKGGSGGGGGCSSGCCCYCCCACEKSGPDHRNVRHSQRHHPYSRSPCSNNIDAGVSGGHCIPDRSIGGCSAHSPYPHPYPYSYLHPHHAYQLHQFHQLHQQQWWPCCSCRARYCPSWQLPKSMPSNSQHRHPVETALHNAEVGGGLASTDPPRLRGPGTDTATADATWGMDVDGSIADGTGRRDGDGGGCATTPMARISSSGDGSSGGGCTGGSMPLSKSQCDIAVEVDDNEDDMKLLREILCARSSSGGGGGGGGATGMSCTGAANASFGETINPATLPQALTHIQTTPPPPRGCLGEPVSSTALRRDVRPPSLQLPPTYPSQSYGGYNSPMGLIGGGSDPAHVPYSSVTADVDTAPCGHVGVGRLVAWPSTPLSPVHPSPQPQPQPRPPAMAMAPQPPSPLHLTRARVGPGSMTQCLCTECRKVHSRPQNSPAACYHPYATPRSASISFSSPPSCSHPYNVVPSPYIPPGLNYATGRLPQCPLPCCKAAPVAPPLPPPPPCTMSCCYPSPAARREEVRPPGIVGPGHHTGELSGAASTPAVWEGQCGESPSGHGAPPSLQLPSPPPPLLQDQQATMTESHLTEVVAAVAEQRQPVARRALSFTPLESGDRNETRTWAAIAAPSACAHLPHLPHPPPPLPSYQQELQQHEHQSLQPRQLQPQNKQPQQQHIPVAPQPAGSTLCNDLPSEYQSSAASYHHHQRHQPPHGNSYDSQDSTSGLSYNLQETRLKGGRRTCSLPLPQHTLASTVVNAPVPSITSPGGSYNIHKERSMSFKEQPKSPLDSHWDSPGVATATSFAGSSLVMREAAAAVAAAAAMQESQLSWPSAATVTAAVSPSHRDASSQPGCQLLPLPPATAQAAPGRRHIKSAVQQMLTPARHRPLAGRSTLLLQQQQQQQQQPHQYLHKEPWQPQQLYL